MQLILPLRLSRVQRPFRKLGRAMGGRGEGSFHRFPPEAAEDHPIEWAGWVQLIEQSSYGQSLPCGTPVFLAEKKRASGPVLAVPSFCLGGGVA